MLSRFGIIPHQLSKCRVRLRVDRVYAKLQSAQMKLSGQKKNSANRHENSSLYMMICFHPSLSISSSSLLGMNSIRLFRDLGPLSTSSLVIWAAIIWIVPVNSNNPPQVGLSHSNMGPDFLERTLGLPELKGSPFFAL